MRPARLPPQEIRPMAIVTSRTQHPDPTGAAPSGTAAGADERPGIEVPAGGQ